jgi:threonine dehydrogenase-like Zn-dependent dehydrogenase
LERDQQVSVRDIPVVELMHDECEVQVLAAGVCSSDIARGFGGTAYTYPLVMGHEVAGKVTKVAPEAEKYLAVGDLVTLFPLLPCFSCPACKTQTYNRCYDYSYYGSRQHGGFSETLNVKTWNLLKIPNGVAIENAALTEPTAVVLHALGKLAIPEDAPSNLCIVGGGFLSLIAIQVIYNTRPKCSVTVIDRNKFKLTMAERYGAKAILLNDEEGWVNYLEHHDSSFDLVLEAAGVPVTYERSLRLVGRGGRVVWMGNISSDLTLSKNLVSTVLRKEINIQGTWNSVYRGNADSDWTKALKLMERGLQPADLVNARIGLDGLAEVLRSLYDHKQRHRRHEVIKAMAYPNGN